MANTTIFPQQLFNLTQSGTPVDLIDVRTPVEFREVHVPFARNVPLDQLAEHGPALADLGTRMVLVCRSGMRARQAEQALRAADVPHLQVLDGGIMGWEQAGLPLRRGRTAWSIERQVRAIAGGLVLLGTLGSVLVWWLLFGLSAFVGGGLVFAGLTDFCGMGLLLARMPWNQTPTTDIPGVLAQMKMAYGQPR